MADVGRDSVNAKNAFNSFVCHVFANLRQKSLFFCVLPKLQKKEFFWHCAYLQIHGIIVLDILAFLQSSIETI